jgi:phosphomevalonate kinase
MRLTVPGNILLLGEYAVLEEGGLGLAAAVERRVVLTVLPAEALEVRGSWPGGSLVWTTGATAASPLVTAVTGTLAAAGFFADRGYPPVHIDIDSSAFFEASGRKMGLGSSAAVAAGLTAALLARAGRKEQGTAEAILAVQAHRAAQGGRGSGYDVLCSWHGGTGIFSGGETPSWEARALAPGLRLCLFPGPAAVQTAGAVLRYAAWKKGNHFAARDFMEESNKRVLAFLDAGSPAEMDSRWAECRALGIQLGEAVGVPAAITPPPGVDPALCKSIGAGNELGVCLVPDGEDSGLPLLPVASGASGLSFLPIASQGLKWE